MNRNLPKIMLDGPQGLRLRLDPRRHSINFELDVFDPPVQLAISFIPGPAKLADLVPTARLLCDELTGVFARNVQTHGEKITCHKGCAHCCRYLVPVSAAEAFRMKDEILAIPTARRTAVVHSSLFAAGRILNSKIPNLTAGECAGAQTSNSHLHNISDWYRSLKLTCPFLANEACTIYQQRPLVCRECMVTSPAPMCDSHSPAYARAVPLAVSVAEALSQVSKSLLGPASEAMILPLALLWCSDNADAARRRWPAEVLCDHFIQAMLKNAEQKTLSAATATV
jgi:Fe-S-cluster containining protein